MTMATVPQEIIDMIIGFLIEDRASLLACSLAGNSFCSPSRAHLFADIEVNNLQRFRGLLELSTTSLTNFDRESPKASSSVRTISVRDVDMWISPEILPSLLFLPLLEPFPRVRDFGIDSLTLPGHTGAETLSMLPVPSLRAGPHAEVGRGFDASRGVLIGGSLADSLDFPTSLEFSTASLKTLNLRNCQAPSLRWLLRYISYFPDLESLSLIDFTWRSIGGEDANESPIFQYPPTPPQSRGLSELTLEVQFAPLVPSAPRLLFESLSGGLRILRLMHIDMFLSVCQSTPPSSRPGGL
ncbi:hypothetical protein BDM02DRAFT_2353428 [Thelephora ganbajun]|uniref:Uncharacterized protein n=1 Tax=Thelephora ganbajun TaxID=370292 RepID=A0ACB6ZF91_THEGA|nr:hypothetical protein BDM02DRAFT_2353428 [Thelephora ganbajun]